MKVKLEMAFRLERWFYATARQTHAGARHWVEQFLGRPVDENETISVRSLPIVKDGPPIEERRQLAEELKDYFAKLDQQREGIDPQELEDAYDEAMRHVRPSYKPIR